VVNPFENDDAMFLVIVNEENQHSLWPIFAVIPSGWAAAFGPDSRQACLNYVETNWTDMRPRGLAVAMDRDRAARTD
jgi:MbtH protein